MTAHCIPSQLSFKLHFGCQITACFNGGRLTSDAGAELLCEVEQQLNLKLKLSSSWRANREMPPIFYTDGFLKTFVRCL